MVTAVTGRDDNDQFKYGDVSIITLDEPFN